MSIGWLNDSWIAQLLPHHLSHASCSPHPIDCHIVVIVSYNALLVLLHWSSLTHPTPLIELQTQFTHAHHPHPLNPSWPPQPSPLPPLTNPMCHSSWRRRAARSRSPPSNKSVSTSVSSDFFWCADILWIHHTHTYIHTQTHRVCYKYIHVLK